MAVFTTGQTIQTTTPTVLVENKLEAGTYRFRLVVIDDEKNASQPTELTVTILPQRTLTQPVLTAEAEAVLRANPVLRPTLSAQPASARVSPTRTTTATLVAGRLIPPVP